MIYMNLFLLYEFITHNATTSLYKWNVPINFPEGPFNENALFDDDTAFWVDSIIIKYYILLNSWQRYTHNISITRCPLVIHNFYFYLMTAKLCADFSLLEWPLNGIFHVKMNYWMHFYVENIYVFIHCSWSLFIVAIIGSICLVSFSVLMYLYSFDEERNKILQSYANKR